MALLPVLALGVLLLLPDPARADAVLKADYRFGGSLASSVGGAPDLVAVDPLGTASYGTDTVFGTTAGTYNHTGNATPTNQQGGLVFDNGSGLLTGNSYSIDMSFKLNERTNAWRRLVDVQNRTSDNGFYVDPTNNLSIFPERGSIAPFVTGQYFDVVLTVGNGTATAYLNGLQQFSYQTTLMNIANPSNPGNLLNFFLDNTQAGGQGEWSSGSVARIALYDGVLTADQIRTNFATPLPPIPTTPPATDVPEPATAALLLTGLGLLAARRRAVPSGTAQWRKMSGST